MLNRVRVGAAIAAAGLVMAIAGVTGVETSFATLPPNTGEVPLKNQVSETSRTDCPDGIGDYWHFVLTPNGNTWSIDKISLQMKNPAEVLTFTGSQIIQNGTQVDNVFVRVPLNHELGDLVAPDADSYAWYSPLSEGDAKNFVLSHTCDGTQTTTTTPPPPPNITPICSEVDVEGTEVKYWFAVEGVTAPISSTSKTQVTYLDKTYTVTAPAEVCEMDVELTKSAFGGIPGTKYTMEISRLVSDGEDAGYVAIETVELTSGETKTITLPASLDPSGISYQVEEIVNGGAKQVIVSPSEFTLGPDLTETVSLEITNYFASVQIVKTVDDTTVSPNQIINYTIVGTNTGGLDLENVSITDQLPDKVTLDGNAASAITFENGSGSCTDPVGGQFTCSFPGLVLKAPNNASDPSETKTPIIKIRAKVGAIEPGEQIVNQSKIVGFYLKNEVESPERLSGFGRGLRVAAVVAPLSCDPVPDGAVCDVSPRNGATSTGDTTTTSTPTTTATTQPPVVTQAPQPVVTVAAGGPVTTVAPVVTPAPPRLPSTGSDNSSLLALGAVLMLIGASLVAIGRRRPTEV